MWGPLTRLTRLQGVRVLLLAGFGNAFFQQARLARDVKVILTPPFMFY